MYKLILNLAKLKRQMPRIHSHYFVVNNFEKIYSQTFLCRTISEFTTSWSSTRTCALNTKLVEGGKELDRKKCIIAWLDTIDSKYPRIPDFKPEYSWFNVSSLVTMDRLGR